MKNLFHVAAFSCRAAILLLFSSALSLQAGAQVAQEELKPLEPSAAILKHYTTAQLDAIAASDPVKYHTIFYYYKQSFIIEQLPCSDCAAFDLDSFDVSKYEEYRKPSGRHTIDFKKYGFRVTLLAIDELQYKLPIHQK